MLPEGVITMATSMDDLKPGDLVRTAFELHRVVYVKRRHRQDGAVLRPANEQQRQALGDGILPSWTPAWLIHKVTPEDICPGGCGGCGLIHLETHGLASVDDDTHRVPREPGVFYGELII